MAAEAAIKMTADSRAVVAAAKQAEGALAGVGEQAGKTGTALQGTARSSEGLEGAMRDLDKSGRAAGQGMAAYQAELSGAAFGAQLLGRAMAALSAVVGVRELVQAADAVTTLHNQLKLATGSVVAAGRAYEALFDIAQRSRVNFIELGGTFAAISRAGQELGISQQRLLTVTESIGNAMTISGGSAQGMQAALQQLSQGLASGALRGDELNSVMEQAPRLARALADGLGVPIGKLREMGAAGEISAQQVISALESQSAVLAGEVSGATLTVGQAFTVLGNASIKAVGEFDEVTGASGTLSAAIAGLSDTVTGLGRAFKDNETVILGTLGVLAGAGTVAGVWKLASAIGGVAGAIGVVKGAFVALSAIAAANPLGLAILGIGAVTGGIIALNRTDTSSLKGLADEIDKTTARIAAAEKQLAFAGGSRNGKDGMTRQLEERIAAMKKYRDELQQDWGAKVGGDVDTSREDARLAALTQGSKASAEAQERLNAERMKGAGVTKEYVASIKVYQDNLAAGNITEKEATAAIAALVQKQYESSAAGKDAAKSTAAGAAATKAAATEYQGLMLRLTERRALADEELAAGAVLSEALRQETRLTEALDSAKSKLSAPQRTATLRALAETQAREALVQQQRANLAADKDLAAQDAKRVQALEARLPQLAEQNKAMAEEIELLGLSEAAQLAVTQARLSSTIAIKEEQLARLQNTEFMSREQIALEEEIRLLKERQALQGQRGEKSIAVAQAKEAESAWKAFYGDLERGLTDSLFRAFEAGQGFFQTLWSGIKNLFKTTVLKLAIQGVVGSVTGGLGAAANAATGSSSGLLGMASNANSLYSLASTGYAATLGSGVASIFGATAGNAAIGAAITGSASSGAAAALAASQAAGTATAASATAASIGSSIAAAVPYLAAALAAAAVINSMLSKKDSRFGGTYADSLDGSGAQYIHGPVQGSTGDQGVRDAVNATVAGINGTLKTLGSTAVLSAYHAGLETSNKGRGGVMAGGTLSNGKAFGESGTGSNYDGTYYERSSTQSPDSAAAAANFATDLKQSIVQALQAAGDVPASIARLVRGVDAEALSDEAVTRLLATINAQIAGVESFRLAMAALPFQNLKNLSFDAASGLAAAAGGFEALGANLSGYYDNFYTEEEKRLQRIKDINAATAGTGLDAATATRQSFRALVESQDVTTASGQAMVAALLGVQGAFASLAPAAAELAGQADTLTGAIGKMFDELAGAISGQRAALATGRETITGGPGVRTYAQIMAGIAASTLSAATARLNAAQAAVATYRGYGNGNFNYYMDLAYGGQDVRAMLPNPSGEFNAQSVVFELLAAQAAKAPAQAGFDAQQAAYAPQLAAYNAAMATQQAALTASQATQAAAALAADAAQLAYAKSVSAWVNASTLSADALGKLKDETLAYYEQQKALADTMHASAAGLRTAVAAAQLSTLTSAQSLDSRMAQFAQDYSLAKSTTGVTKAGYADKMAGQLPQLSADLAGTSASRVDWAVAVAKLSSQSQLIAEQLEASAPATYEAQSLTLLDAIDGKLASMNATAASLQVSITTAVQAGAAKTAAGLSNLIKAVQGDKSASLQAFATGGVFTNGIVSSPTVFNMGLMGEAGSEAIVPLAVGPGGDLGIKAYGNPGGAGDGKSAQHQRELLAEIQRLNTRMEVLNKEVQQMRQENNIGNAKIADSTDRTARLQERWSTVGLPATEKPTHA